MEIRIFNFNAIQVNTFLLYDETKEAVLIDPGMGDERERASLKSFIEDNDLKIKYIIATHPHIDHVLGCGWCVKQFGAPLLMNEEGKNVYRHAVAYGVAFNMQCEKEDFPPADRNISDGETIVFGNQCLEILETPGHCAGSVSLYHRAAGLLFVGDLIFQGSIGRTDLPTGSSAALMESIQSKILPLPDDTIIYPGHGPSTTLSMEKSCNPYF